MIVACVLRSGGIYDPSWVDALYQGVRDNWDIDSPLEFVCLTDFRWSRRKYYTARLKHDWPGWWAKIELFNRAGYCNTNAVYLDLDNVINGPMSVIAGRHLGPADYGFRVMRDPYTGGLQSAVMRWSGAWLRIWGHQIYSTFEQMPQTYMRDYSSGGDQLFIEDLLRSKGKRWSYWRQSEVSSFKVDWAYGQCPVSSVVQFHGAPKPPDIPFDHPLKRKWDRYRYSGDLS